MPPRPAAALVPGRWFDGLSSKPQPVLIGLRPAPRGPMLVLHRLGTPRTPAPAPQGTTSDAAPHSEPQVFAHSQVGWPEAWNARQPQTQVVVDLRQHGSIEIEVTAEWYQALAAVGAPTGWAQRMQTRWPMLLGVAVLAVAALTLFYRYGTPWAATQLTRTVPLAWEVQVAEGVLAQMDEGPLRPSTLSPQRQAELQARLAALVQQASAVPGRYRQYTPRLQLAFRQGLGANAFALPGGQLVMTDGMVQAAARAGLSDDALVGVLAHEMGHAVYRHSTRMVVEQGVLNIGLGLALGDVSTLVSTGASVLTGLAYSRGHEREADCYALALMRHATLPTAPMGHLLLAIAQDDAAPATPASPTSGTVDKEQPSAGANSADRAKKPAPSAHAAWSLLSSHPDTERRAQALLHGDAAECRGP